MLRGIWSDTVRMGTGRKDQVSGFVRGNVLRVLARRWPDGWPGAPAGRAWDAGQALMDLGRVLCTARAPACERGCPLRAGCPAADSGQVTQVTPLDGARAGTWVRCVSVAAGCSRQSQQTDGWL